MICYRNNSNYIICLVRAFFPLLIDIAFLLSNFVLHNESSATSNNSIMQPRAMFIMVSKMTENLVGYVDTIPETKRQGA